MFWIIDAAGNIVGTTDGTGAAGTGTSVPPPDGATKFINGVWVIPSPPVAPNLHITRLAFLNRLTLTERVAIRSAAAAGELVIADFLDLLSASLYVDLALSTLQDGVAYMVTKTLLTQSRADAILTAPIQDTERPL